MIQRFAPALKIGAIVLLTLLLLLPMARIRGLIHERQALRDEVVQDIARSAAYAQTLTGPVLIVPYVKTVHEQQLDSERRPILTTREVAGELRLLPATLEVAGRLGTEERQRGIYRARIFNAASKLKGHFDIAAGYGIESDLQDYRFGPAHLALGISDIRGIGNALALRTNGQVVTFQPGTGTALLAQGVQAPLSGLDAKSAQSVDYEIDLNLLGTGDFQVTPVGRETRVLLSSDWPHPRFAGEFLPKSRDVNASGFSAEWQTSFFATNMEEALARCQAQGDSEQGCADFRNRSFGVSFVNPVDQYLKSERATKYAFLFIALTFAGFFLFEVLRHCSVHPVQYGLVGLALAMFFLLLLSLSEHIGFAAAYALSAIACVGLITFYVVNLLGRAGGGTFGVALASLYGLLYGILSSEDYALLMGTLLVFGLLAAVMVLTRRVSWGGAG